MPNKKPESEKAADEAQKIAALTEAKILLAIASQIGEPLPLLKSELEAIDALYEAVDRFEYRGGAEDKEVWMIGSEYYVGRTGEKIQLGDGKDLTGSNWKFNPAKDVDMRGTGLTHLDALDEAFRRTGLTKEEFIITKTATDLYGKTLPVEFRHASGAQVNYDIPELNNVKQKKTASGIENVLGEGPHHPHIGYQTSGKRINRIRGHIFVDIVPATRD